jgi:hypothetical protein
MSDQKPQDRVDQLAAQLDKWGIDLKALRAARGDRAGAETRVVYDRQLADVCARLDGAQSHLQDMTAAGSMVTKEMRQGIDRTWAEVSQAFDGVAARFQ